MYGLDFTNVQPVWIGIPCGWYFTNLVRYPQSKVFHLRNSKYCLYSDWTYPSMGHVKRVLLKLF